MLTIAAQMRPASRLRDDSVTLKFVTAQEISTELFSEIDSYRAMNGWLLFSADKPKDTTIPTTQAVEGEQSPSQQLRGALWLLHQRRGGADEAWPAFYERQMERIRNLIIGQLE